MQGNVAEMADTAHERRQADQKIAALEEWKTGHSEQCVERGERTESRIERIEGRFDKLEEYLRSVNTKLIFAIIGGVAFAAWELLAPHINLH